MKFKKYLEMINELAKKRPETLEYDVIYSERQGGDEECRNMDWDISVGMATNKGEWARDFIPEGDYEKDLEWHQSKYGEYKSNAVCIN